MGDKTLEIQIRANDKASQIAEKVQQKFSKIGNSASKAMGKATSATNNSRNAMKNLDNYFKVVQGSSDGMTKHAITGLTKMTNAEKQAALQMIKMSENVSQGSHVWDNMSNSTLRFADHVKLAEHYVQGLGHNVDSTRGKILVVGTAITSQISSKLEPLRTKLTPFTNAWNNVKTRISNVGSVIKSQISSAIDGVKNKVKGLINSFDGLGGVISTAVGAIGMASIGELTIGLSLSREKMSSLNTAIMGSKDASDQLLESINKMTDTSVVSMDQMVTAMNKIKLSTQMSNKELSSTKDVVMKLGEASMLMGNDTETAAYQMGEAFSGLNGDFQILKENFGITKEKMKEMGWKGNANDVEGYTKALEKCLDGLGDLGSVMETNSGKIAQVQKKFRTAGRTLGDMLTPYIGQAADAFLNLEKTFPGIAQGLVVTAGGVSMFATIAPTLNHIVFGMQNVLDVAKSAGEGVRALGSAIGIMSSAEELAGAAAATSAVGHEIAAGAEMTEAAAAGTAAASTWALLWPVLAVTAAIAAIALVVYEVGKAFGWWDDIGSMVAAITAGIKRLWAAFINNPDVQDFIKGISDAWAWIAPRIEPAIQSVLEFLGISQGGEFDVVRAIIDGVGAAFHALTNHIRTALSILSTVVGVFQSIHSFLAPYGELIRVALSPIVCILLGCSPGIVPALEKVHEVFGSVWAAISGIVNTAVSGVVAVLQMVVGVAVAIFNSVNTLIFIFTKFATGQLSLQQTLTIVWNVIVATLRTIFNIILSTVVSWATSFVSKALDAGRQFVNNIILFIKTLPGRVLSYLTRTTTHMLKQGTQWVNTAKTKATALVTGTVSNLSKLPRKAYTQLHNVVPKITSAGASWVNTAKTKAGEMVTGIKNKLTGVPSAVYNKLIGIKDKIRQALSKAYDTAKTWVNKIKKTISNVGGGMNAFGGADLAYGGEDLETPTTKITTKSNDKLDVNMKQSLDIIIDLKNIPSGIDESLLYNVVVDTLNRKEVINQLVNNNDFQSLDSKVKAKIIAKSKRARGV